METQIFKICTLIFTTEPQKVSMATELRDTRLTLF